MVSLRLQGFVTEQSVIPAASCFRAVSHNESRAAVSVKQHASVKSYPLFPLRGAVNEVVSSSTREQEKGRLHVTRRQQKHDEFEYELGDTKEIHFSRDEEKLLQSLASTDGRKERHSLPKGVFKSAGSRSTPSRSTIPGLRSKYSKPDPKLRKSRYVFRNPNNIRQILCRSDSGSDTLDTDEETIDWLDSESEDDETGTCFHGLPKTHLKSSKETAGGLGSGKLDAWLSASGRNAKKPQEEKDGCVYDQCDRSTEIHSTNQMVSSGAVVEDELIVSEDSIPTNAKYKVDSTGCIHDRQKTVSAITDVAEISDWKRHPLCDLPFDIQYSYSETPNAPIVGFRDMYSPFGPATMQRPWTGLPPRRPRQHLENCLNSVQRNFKLNCYPEGSSRRLSKSREETLGKPLTHEEITHLVNKCHEESRQVNLGRDGLTHNMLYLIHTHWKKLPVCKIKCRGVPTVDMENLCFHIEDKTGGNIIYRSGGVLYVFRGRNYSHRNHPRIPLMLWKPASPIYPKVVPKVPAGLTTEEAYKLRVLGQKVEPLCKLGKNAVYLNLVADVREAFRVDDLVVLNYEGLNSSDYKKIAAKLRDLVPCVILSFRNERILLWKGRAVDASIDGRVHLDDHHSPKVIDSEPSMVKSTAVRLDSMNGLHQSKLCSMSDEPPLLQPGNVLCDSSDVFSGRAASGNILSDKASLGQRYVDGTAAVSDILVLSENLTCSGNDCEHSYIHDEQDSTALSKEDWSNDECYQAPIHDDIDVSWELALRCGMALEFEDSSFDADRILHRSDMFSRIASTVPDYSEKLINRLRIKVDRGINDKHAEVHFYTKCRKPRKQLKETFQTSPHRNIQADDLVRLLSPIK